MNNISKEIRLKKKRRKDMLIFCLYMAVGALGLVGACYSDTIPLCLILVIVSVFAIVCGFEIKRQGTIGDDLGRRSRKNKTYYNDKI